MECPPPSPDISLVALTVAAAHIPQVQVRGQVEVKYRGTAPALGSRRVVGCEARGVGWGLKMPGEGSVLPGGQDIRWAC